MTTFKAAAIQLAIRQLSPTSNFANAKAHIETAAAHGCRLAVLPEYVLTGWVPEDPKFADLAEDRTYLEKFCELAKACKINIVPGTFVERHTERDQDLLYNIAYFISEDGEILGSYTKKNLWHTERTIFESSGHTPHSIIDTPLGKVGLLICWDLAFPEAFRQLILQGAQIIVIPSFWTQLDSTAQLLSRNPASEEIFLSSVVVARAFENTACVIFANAGGEKELGFAGQSQIALAGMGATAKADGPEEQMVVGEVDMEVLIEAEECYRVREDLGRERFHYGGLGSV